MDSPDSAVLATATMFDSIPIPISVSDSRSHAILYMNDSFCEMIGRSRGEVLGRHCETFTHPDDISDSWSKLDPFFKGETRKAYHEKRYIKADNSVVWTGLTFFRQSGPEEDSFHVVVANNITGQKKKEALLHSRTIDLQRAREAIFSSMAILSEFRDRETGEHILRTRLYVKLLLENFPGTLPFSHKAISLISSSAILHDIGKVGIPDAILLKPGKLTDEEFDVMKSHTTLGSAAIFRTQRSMYNDSFLAFAKEIAEFHHERWDGSGYPSGLSGAEIPLTARVMAIADVYDALRSDRPYKKAQSHEEAVSIIMQESGSHFDPVICGVFHDFRDEFARIASTEKEHLEREIEDDPVRAFE